MPPVRSEIKPHLFTGTATINGSPAPDDTRVTAWVEGFREPVGDTTVSGGLYFFRVFQYGDESFAGKTVTFKVGGLDALETATWESGGSTPRLNLTASD